MRKLIPLVVVIVGVFLAAVFILYNQSRSVVGDQNVIAEINRLQLYPEPQVYSLTDFDTLNALTRSDPHAQGYMEEMLWLVAHNETEHVDHSLYYLSEYVRTGEEVVCMPHELEHIKIYIEHEEYDLAESQRKIAEDTKAEWFRRAQNLRAKFPQYYPNYDRLISSIDESMIRLENKQYDQHTVDLLQFIGENSVC